MSHRALPRALLTTVFVLAGVSAGTGACGGEQRVQPAYGEALVIVDTDLAVPQLAGRLRVDVYTEDGMWIESRDIGRSDRRDWPASFSVYSDDDTRERRALVRLRAYPEGVVRPYSGERVTPQGAFHTPAVARSLAELCASAPELPLGGRVTMRRGAEPITDLVRGGSCTEPTETGSIAARVTVTTPGAYRFDVASALPWMTTPTLFLRSRCEDVSSQIACNLQPTAGPALTSSGHFPRFDATLQPGTYFLITGGSSPGWPADLTLEWISVDTPTAPPLVSSDPTATSKPPLPRLLQSTSLGAHDVTPETEPVPAAAVDRLVLVRLVPNERGRVRVTMRGACAGTAAKLGADPTRPDPKTAATCIDTIGTLAPVSESPLEPDMTRPTSSEQGTFGTNEPCDASTTTTTTSSSDIACIPGGAFLFGSSLTSGAAATDADTTPERLALVHRFWMDRHEVTVARWRDAVTRGMPTDASRIVTSDLPFPSPDQAPQPDSFPFDLWCAYSHEPMGREDYAITCVAWRAARAFCQMQGGDLPTEAQWEYAALAAGRRFKTIFPWGDEEPGCDRAYLGHGRQNLGMYDGCLTSGFGPGPVTAADGHDVTPLGVVGLAGGVQEWMRDGAEPFLGDCWTNARIDTPICDEEHAPQRVTRGGSWDGGPTPLAWRFFLGGQLPVGDPKALRPGLNQGFRCVYDHPPPSVGR